MGALACQSINRRTAQYSQETIYGCCKRGWGACAVFGSGFIQHISTTWHFKFTKLDYIIIELTHFYHLAFQIHKIGIHNNLIDTFLKVAFFQKVRFVFQISPKKYSKKLSWAWNLKKFLLIWADISNFKLRIVFWKNSFGRF